MVTLHVWQFLLKFFILRICLFNCSRTTFQKTSETKIVIWWLINADDSELIPSSSCKPVWITRRIVARNAVQHFGGKNVATYLNVICSSPLEECRKTTKVSDKVFLLAGAGARCIVIMCQTLFFRDLTNYYACREILCRIIERKCIFLGFLKCGYYL